MGLCYPKNNQNQSTGDFGPQKHDCRRVVVAHFDATVVTVVVLSVRCEHRLKKKMSIKRWKQLSIEHEVGLIEAGGVIGC